MPKGIYKRTKEWKQMMKEKMKGRKITWVDKISGEKNYLWKGEKVGYNGLHAWVRRQLGKPKKCEFCGKDRLTGRNIHWANIGHLYKRNLTDWIRLCKKCHKKYDKEFLNNG